MRRMIKETEISKLDAINTNDLAKLDNISEADIQRLNNITDADVARLNNITDADVARLNKLTDNDVNKIQSITNDDIQSVKAMESPKNATADYVLTADGTGKATYKPAKGGGGGGKEYMLSTVNWGITEQQLTFYTPNTPLPENIFGSNQLCATFSPGTPGFINQLQILSMQAPSGTVIQGNVSANNSLITIYNGDSVDIYMLEELQNQLGLTTSGDVATCNISYTTTSLNETGA